MKEKNSKRVVIIDEIDSGTIEQAIFILRNNGTEEKPGKGSIVKEAERIINAYVHTIEGTQRGINKKEGKIRRSNVEKKSRKDMGIWIAVACFTLALGFVLHGIGLSMGI